MNEYRNSASDKNMVSFSTVTVVDGYRIVKELSNCPTSETCLAEDTSLNRQVVLNFLPSPLIRDEVAKARFVQSVKNAAIINHPNLVYIHEFAEYQGRPYFVTEYFIGSSLADTIGKGLPVSYKLLDTFIQICEGLRTAHKNGVIHQSLNPGCVLINDEGHVKISVFGLANIIMNIKSLQPDLYHEIISYMAPEQLQSKRADTRSDIFSVGILLYELLTGQHPFKKQSATATIQAIINENQAIPSHLTTEIPIEIQTIITKTLEKNPEERYQYVDDLQNDLKRAGTDLVRQKIEADFSTLHDDILDSSHTGYCILDAGFRIVWMNRALERYFGLHREKVIGLKITKLLETYKSIFDNPEEVITKLKATYENNTYIEHFECYLLPGEGRDERWLEHWSQPINSGQYTGGRIEQYRDITERKKIEQKIKESEHEKEVILNSLLEHVVYQDTSMKILWANKTAAESLGLTQKELIGKYCYELWARQDTPCEDCPVTKAMKSNQPQVTEKETSDGRSWYIKGYPVNNLAGEIIGGIEITLEITDSRKAEKMLLASEEKFRKLSEAAEEAIIIHDNGIIIETNEAFNRMFGYESRELIGKSAEILATPDTWNLILKQIETGYDKPYEGTGIRKDGSTFICQLVGKPFEYLGQSIRVAVLRDITELKNKEKKLKILSSITQQCSEGIALTDMEGNIKFVNEAFANMHGYEPEELTGKNLKIFHTPEQLIMVEKATNRLQKTGVFYGEIWHTRKDGSIFPTIMMNSLFRDESNNVTGMIGTMRDISSQKKTETALKESQRTLSTLMNNLPGMAYRCKNDQYWTMEFVSEGFTSLTGYKTSDVIYNKRIKYNEIIHPEDRKDVWEEVQKKLKKNEPFRLTYRIKTKDKKEKWVWELGCGVYQNNELAAIEGFITDITERVQSEIDLKKLSEKLQNEHEALTEKNIALKQILEHLESEKKNYQDRLLKDIDSAITPLLKKMKKSTGPKNMEDFEALEAILNKTLAKDFLTLEDRFESLSPRELQICKLIKNGMSSKEISDKLTLSITTVHKHRETIRRKLGITNKNINLSRFLQLH